MPSQTLIGISDEITSVILAAANQERVVEWNTFVLEMKGQIINHYDCTNLNRSLEKLQLKAANASESEVTTALTPEDMKIMETRHLKLTKKWKLRSGRYVEDVIYEEGKNYVFDHPFHSYIISLDDENVTNYNNMCFGHQSILHYIELFYDSASARTFASESTLFDEIYSFNLKVRSIGSTSKIDRQAVGDIPDLSFIYSNNELGCVEIGLTENGSNVPKMMRNFCWKLINDYEVDPTTYKEISRLLLYYIQQLYFPPSFEPVTKTSSSKKRKSNHSFI
ncbi:hypothetical protein BDF21DRAFT_437426 [Thamnidium elegans]|nr:hypothetical protein BDF21DRAFT_437426 [Thamnidium elegans]